MKTFEELDAIKAEMFEYVLSDIKGRAGNDMEAVYLMNTLGTLLLTIGLSSEPSRKIWEGIQDLVEKTVQWKDGETIQ